MLSNNKEVNYLIHLMSCALNQKEPKIDESIDFNTLLELSKKHQIYNIIFPLIMDLKNVSDKDKNDYEAYHYKEITKMIVVNNERNEILKEFANQKIKFMPLKGLILKNYYPKESMRQMSDNDILIEDNSRKAIKNIMLKRDYKLISTCENSDDYNKKPYCAFEFHRKLFFDELDFHPDFDFVWDNSNQDVDNQYQLNMNINDVYLYTIAHMYKHFSTAGCGVRFLADIYVFLKKEYDNLDWKYINKKLDDFGILDYEKKSKGLAINLFDEKDLTNNQFELFKIYMNSGVYGKQTVKIEREVVKSIESNNSNLFKGKIKYIFKRIFPSKKEMMRTSKTLEAKPYLLPLFYLIRPIRAIINYKKTINEIETINEIKKK